MCARKSTDTGYFLPYQINWLQDASPIKLWRKSRRIGATYVQSYEDVCDAATGRVPAVWFTSADETASKEYILYCAQWARAMNYAAMDLGEIVIDNERNIKALSIEFANHRRINALSSNPKGFRSKGGKVILDEFAWHDDQQAMWKAARPSITWGHPMRILSSHNGKAGLFYKFGESIENGKLNWSLHTTDIYLAVKQGLADKIVGHALTDKERADWIEELHRDCFDETTWLQEYCCQPVDETTAFLTYDLIRSCELDMDICETPDFDAAGDLYLGMDIARRKHLSVIWVIEDMGLYFKTRVVRVMEMTKFSEQREVLYSFLSHPRLRRACIDQTGLGMQLTEEAIEHFGSFHVEGVTFTNKVKEALAVPLRSSLQDRGVIIPAHSSIRDDLHSVRQIITPAGNARFDADMTDSDGHADRFWALTLALHASDTIKSAPVRIDSIRYRPVTDDFRAFGR